MYHVNALSQIKQPDLFRAQRLHNKQLSSGCFSFDFEVSYEIKELKLLQDGVLTQAKLCSLYCLWIISEHRLCGICCWAALSVQDDNKGEDSCHLWSLTWFSSLTTQSDQFEAIYSLSAGFTPYLVRPARKACTLHQNVLWWLDFVFSQQIVSLKHLFLLLDAQLFLFPL